MKQYEYIDEYIADQCDALGATYTKADVESWAFNNGYDINVAACLTTHRQSPRKRVFTTERVGMGPRAYYRVIERTQGVSSPSLLRMHQQQGQEMVKRWANEYRYRLAPVAGRSKKAQAALTLAEAQIKQVASAMHAHLAYLEEDDDES